MRNSRPIKRTVPRQFQHLRFREKPGGPDGPPTEAHRRNSAQNVLQNVVVMVGLHRSAFHLQLAARRHAQQGVLKITPIEKSTPPEAEVLAARFYDVLPRIRITDLLFGGGAMDAVHRLFHPSVDG